MNDKIIPIRREDQDILDDIIKRLDAKELTCAVICYADIDGERYYVTLTESEDYEIEGLLHHIAVNIAVDYEEE